MAGIQDKDLGRYKRPAIFINEIDNSIVELPVQDVLINLIPGFSKKGPVNNPVYVTNPTDFKSIFGDIDKGLERKGSYFHRTCIKMLQSGPIWAVNLLATNDERDLLSWKSISVGSAFANASTQSMPYSRLFNRQDFWTRDSESFLDYVNDPTEDTERLLHITNMGQKTITVFTYKSAITGFDVTAENWYGGATKVPSYIHPKDWMSDYIISVLVLEGDWTDYKNLTADSTWGNYFTSVGLDKTTVQDFVNETNVTTLAFYDCSLIPYFKDINGKDMYIKTVINNNTNKTGLFCTYNEDVLLDSDYPTGKMDLIGDGLVGETATSIDFLSYQESVIETLTYTETLLDSHSNVFGNYSTDLTSNYASMNSRTGSKTNWFIHDATVGASASTFYQISEVTNSSGASWFQVPDTYDVENPSISTYHTPWETGDVVYLSKTYAGLSANTAYYICNLTQGGTWFSISATFGGDPIVIDVTTQPSGLYFQRINLDFNFNPGAYFNLGGTAYTFNTGSTKLVFDPLVFDTINVSMNRYDALYVTAGNEAEIQILKGEQSNTTALLPSFTSDYNDAIIIGYVKHYVGAPTVLSADTYVSYAISSDYTPITLDSTGYVPLTGIQMSGYTALDVNYVKLSFNNTSGATDLKDYTKLRYRGAYTELDSYLSDSKGVIINRVTGYKYYIVNPTSTDYSPQYNASIIINVGSISYSNFYSDNYKFLIYYLDNEFIIKDSGNGTNRLLTTLAPVDVLVGSGQTSTTNAGVIGLYSDIYLDYYNGIFNNGDFGYEYNISGLTATKIYMKAWLQDDTYLYVDLMAADLISPIQITNWDHSGTTGYDYHFNIWSNISNYRQTLEIEYLDTTKMPNLVYEIAVDKTRYSEVKKGNFIEAWFDVTAEGDPKKLARVISTSISSTNSNWKVLKTDMPIQITTIAKIGGGYDYQTNLYPQVDVYVSTYKGIKLTPFTIHADSMPTGADGSQVREVRQSSILDVIGKTTNLAKGLANKNKISWRYLVDSFGNGLTSLSKQQYADLCAMKLNCLGFINAPSVKQLKNSSSPSFINDDRTLNTAFLKAGGDEDKNPSFLYSFAEGVGRSCVAYFFPFVTVDDSGIPKNVPPSAWVATTYMRKHTSSSASVVPWTICAGINDGRVTDIAGVEMDFTDEDLENLYSMNLNPIVKKKNAGYCINSESTAQVFPYSALSIIHSREVLIELENSLYDMLLRYQWRFNTPEIRAEIKFRADKICKDLQDRNALYAYKNIIDDTNNKNYIIDLQMGVLDTYIEIVRGMGMIINNITILKKGDLESTGFKA